MSEIAGVRDHLVRRFAAQRMVFWHDAEGEYAEDLVHLELPGVSLIRVSNDEYGVKNRLLHEEPTGQFLVYRSGASPAGVANWLLDLELAYGVFTADRTSLIQNDLGLTADGIDEVLRSHEKFFRAAKRAQALKALLEPRRQPGPASREDDRRAPRPAGAQPA